MIYICKKHDVAFVTLRDVKMHEKLHGCDTSAYRVEEKVA